MTNQSTDSTQNNPSNLVRYHIPPIYFESGSLILTTDLVPTQISGNWKYRLVEGKKIEWVKVLLQPFGDVVFSSYHNNLAKHCKINIWMDGNKVIEIGHPNGGYDLELNSDKEFKLESPSNPHKRRYAGTALVTGLEIANGNQTIFYFDNSMAGEDGRIKWVQIWPEGNLSH